MKAWDYLPIHEKASKKAKEELKTIGYSVHDLTYHNNDNLYEKYIRYNPTLTVIRHRPDKIAISRYDAFQFEIKKNGSFIDLCSVIACYAEYMVQCKILFCWYDETDYSITWTDFRDIFNSVEYINIPPKWDEYIAQKMWYELESSKIFPDHKIKYFPVDKSKSNDPFVKINKENLIYKTTEKMFSEINSII